MKYIPDVLLWIGYCALHSYLISTSFTKWITRHLKNYYAFYRLFYIMISLALLIPLIRFTARLNDPVIMSNEYPWSIVRSVIMVGSLLLFFWAFFFNYDSLSFFGIRQMMAYGKPKESFPPAEVKKGGLLGIMRHPMYFALILYLWCQTFRMSDIVVNTVLTVYVIIGTWLEEKKLVLEFGEAYVRYQHEVPMLIPFTKRMKRGT